MEPNLLLQIHILFYSRYYFSGLPCIYSICTFPAQKHIYKYDIPYLNNLRTHFGCNSSGSANWLELLQHGHEPGNGNADVVTSYDIERKHLLRVTDYTYGLR
jgi:hypothetical protein